jgi:hypothetical protein
LVASRHPSDFMAAGWKIYRSRTRRIAAASAAFSAQAEADGSLAKAIGMLRMAGRGMVKNG